MRCNELVHRALVAIPRPAVRAAGLLGSTAHVMANTINPKRVLLVVAPVLLATFFLGTSIAGELTKMAAPYLVFGARGQGLTVVHDYRHSVTFSDGTIIRGVRLLPLDLMWGILSAIFVMGLFFLSLRIVARFIRWRDSAFADAVLHFWKLK